MNLLLFPIFILSIHAEYCQNDKDLLIPKNEFVKKGVTFQVIPDPQLFMSNKIVLAYFESFCHDLGIDTYTFEHRKLYTVPPIFRSSTNFRDGKTGTVDFITMAEVSYKPYDKINRDDIMLNIERIEHGFYEAFLPFPKSKFLNVTTFMSQKFRDILFKMSGDVTNMDGVEEYINATYKRCIVTPERQAVFDIEVSVQLFDKYHTQFCFDAGNLENDIYKYYEWPEFLYTNGTEIYAIDKKCAQKASFICEEEQNYPVSIFNTIPQEFHPDNKPFYRKLARGGVYIGPHVDNNSSVDPWEVNVYLPGFNETIEINENITISGDYVNAETVHLTGNKASSDVYIAKYLNKARTDN